MQEENSGIEESSVHDLFYQLGGSMKERKKAQEFCEWEAILRIRNLLWHVINWKEEEEK